MAYLVRRCLDLIIISFIFSVLALSSGTVYAEYQPPMPPSPGDPQNGKISFYEPSWDTHISLADENRKKIDFHVRGERWSYRTSLGESQDVQKEAIHQWISQAQCTILADLPDHLMAEKQSALNEKLVYYFNISNTTIDVEIYLDRQLMVDHPVSMTIGGEGREGFDFWVDHDGKNFQSLVVEFENDWVYVNGRTQSNFDVYQRSVTQRNDLRIEHGARQVLFDIPQYQGPYKWHVRTRSKTPQTVKISLEKGPALPELKDGMDLGAVRVHNLPFGSVNLIPEWDPSIRHPGFNMSAMRADRTPEGDAVFWVPSGYWQVQGVPPQKEGVSYANAHMIPVHAGRITEVDWPRSISGLFAPQGVGRLEILGVRHRETIGEVDISLVELDENIVPQAALVNCYEGGLAGKIVSVEPLKSPLHVVLLLDSSGSMKGSMDNAVAATKSFVQRFEENAQITVVDFDTKPKKLEAANRFELLKALDGVRANGATSLYDSTLLGLDYLKSEDRRALVLFTDGVDANWNDTGPGSKATKPEVMQAVETAKTPVYTIGFGKSPDVDTLTRVASLSGGTYYEAHDKDTLDAVFTKISENLGRQYRVTYKRPQAAGLSDVPVIAIVVDNSGSMDLDPARKGCDFRIQKVKEILKEFRYSLPDEFLVQLLTFSDTVRASQVITSEPVPLLRGLSLMQGSGGTNILGSTQAALDTLKTVSSTRRYLVYLADAAMKVDERSQKQMDILLSSFKDENIQCLFVGVVDTDEGGAFEHAAKMSGGKYLISTDLEKVKTAFSELAGRIGTTNEAENRISLRLTLSDRDARGRNRLFSAGQFVKFPRLPVSDEVVSPEAVAWHIGGPLIIYDELVANIVSGSDRLEKSTRVAKRIPLEVRGKNGETEPGVKGKNEAMELSAMEMVFLSRLRGIDPPSAYRYLVLPLKITNILKSQKVAVYKDGSQHPAAWMAGSAAPERYEEKIPPYLIPDLMRHLFLTWNEETTLPVSPVTWLCEEPILIPGERALSVSPNQPVNGACAFLVPNTEMTQAALHFYDVNYGNIDIPLTGVMPSRPVIPSALPTKPPKDLGSSFSLNISRVEDCANVGQIPGEEGFVFRIIEGYLTSKIQALLALDPAKRFTYHLPTDKGDFIFTLHPSTELLPMGFYQATMVAPGARNVIRMAFRMPKQMAELADKGYLFVDVYGGGVRLDLADAPAKPPQLTSPDASGQGVDIFVNASGTEGNYVGNKRGNLVVVDVTFQDQTDRSHTRIGPLLVLKKKGAGAEDQEEYRKRQSAERFKIATQPHRGLGGFAKNDAAGAELTKVTGASRACQMEDTLMFGLDEKSVIFDGQTHRGVMVFELPRDEKIEEWEIGSLILDNVALPINNKPFKDTTLLSKRMNINDEIGSGFWNKLAEKVSELQAQRRAVGYERPGEVSPRPVDLDTADLGKQPVSVISASSLGARALKKTARTTDIWKLIKGLDWVPGRSAAWSQRYAPEAVLAQGWGDPSDLASLADRLLNLQGILTIRAEVELTKQGKTAMAKTLGSETVRIDSLPALRYTDAKDKDHFMVFPWCKELDELKGLVAWDGSKDEPYDRRQKIRIRVELELEAIESQAMGATRDAASALAGGGGSKTKKVIVLDETYRDDDLSLDAVDIGFTEIREDGHPTLRCLIEGPNGRQMGKNGVTLDAWAVKNEVIYVDVDRSKPMVQQPVTSEKPITGRFHILSINAPDLDQTKAAELEKLRTKKYTEAKDPDGLSALRWYGRSVIDRFVAAQTRFERRLAKKLDLTIGRSLNGRCILVTVQRSDIADDPSAMVDLLYVANDIHGGKPTDAKKASHAFNILSGLASARFEAAAIPTGGLGIFELWQHCPEGTQLAYIDGHNKREFLDMLKEKDYPESLVKHLDACRNAVLFPTHPAIINDTARWGWLEIDPKTYSVVSRLDNGAAGAMIETLIGDLYQQATSYLVGALVGIDASLWSVAAFSLELEDYDEICEKAMKFALNIEKNYFGIKEGDKATVGSDIGGTPAAEYSFDRYVKFSLDMEGFKASNNMLGFGNGYKDAVAYYFMDQEE